MSSTHNITSAFCRTVAFPPSGRTVYRDNRMPGFAVEVSHNETITFYRIGRIAGKMTRYKLGNFPALSADDARKACAALNGQIALGIDPRAGKRARQDAAIHDGHDTSTMQGMFDWYMTHVSRPNKANWRKEQLLWDRVFKQRWGAAKLSAIKRHMIVELQTELRDTPMAANQAVILLRCLFHEANMNEFFTGNPAATVVQFKKRHRERYLSQDELVTFVQGLQKIRDPWRDAFMFALTTGARRANVMAARWDQMDMVHALWAIPAAKTKAKKFILLPLNSLAMAILERRIGNDSEWVFPCNGPHKSKPGHITSPQRRFKEILDTTGLTDIRFHDLRHFFASFLANDGVSVTIIARALAHASGSTATDRYLQLTDDTVRRAVESVAEKIIDATPQKKSENR